MFRTQAQLFLKQAHSSDFCLSKMAPLSNSKKKKLLAGIAVVLSLHIKRCRLKKRRKWVKGWKGERQELGVFNTLVQELASEKQEAIFLDWMKRNLILF